MTSEEEQVTSPAGLSAGRIEALADGVFAIAMTLLILELKVPRLPHGAPAEELAAALAALWPQALAYILSFLTLGTFWIAHRGQFHFIHRTDRPLLWINVVFLMIISTIPFWTALLGEYRAEQLPVILYGLSMLTAVLALYANWRYATARRNLVAADLSHDLIAHQSRRILFGPLTYLVAIVLAFLDPHLSVAIYVLIPFAYMLPGAVDRHWLNSGR